MSANHLFRQQGVELQFEENDKVVMCLKSTAEEKQQLSNLVRKSFACHIISNLTFFTYYFNSVSLAKLLRSWRQIILDTV